MYDSLIENFRRGNYLFTVYAIGENGVKIPIKIGEGNGWSDKDDVYDYGYRDHRGKKIPTACLFGYLDPFDWKSAEN